MGWCGYGMYDGDDTFVRQLDYLEVSKISCIPYEDMSKIKLSLSDKLKVGKHLKEIITFIRKQYNDENEIRLSYLLLGDLLINNNIQLSKKLKYTIMEHCEDLLGDHCDEFKQPYSRRKVIKNFMRKLIWGVLF